ncbi:RNA polymerase M/15 kDa subunit [Zalerion maritima]|uniref:RNA polymerase M/15 kDa subunit n=1 Tax=Zalerion maritima TaxID=339359 RepID=A0AAD5RGR6_9PEZI|nr:RNA polymerase M/15 kDa subunit [Zalerion maritima]
MTSPQSTSTAMGGGNKKKLEQITFRFCSECSNMLYPKEDEQNRKLQFTCRTCQYTEEAATTCIFRNELDTSVGETAGVTQDVGSDPTVGLSQLPAEPVFCLLCGCTVTCLICGSPFDPNSATTHIYETSNSDDTSISSTMSHATLDSLSINLDGPFMDDEFDLDGDFFNMGELPDEQPCEDVCMVDAPGAEPSIRTSTSPRPIATAS